MAIAIIASSATSEEAAHGVLRATALSSVLLFSAAFSASALRRFWPNATTRWMLANRRYVGVSFAVSHLVHLGAIVSLATFASDHFDVSAVTLVAGGLGFVAVAAMAATSFDRTAAWLGARRWKLLHTIAGYYLWFVFVATYVPNVARSAWLAVPVMLLFAVLALRLMALRRAA